jgi:hypothetical protein
VTTLEYLAGVALPSALVLLPEAMDTPAARAMVLAICLQESGVRERQQIGGPAMGFAQFERAGIEGVISHPASRAHILEAIITLRYPADIGALYRAVRDNDVLAMCFARCLLWTDASPLPGHDEHKTAWEIYLRTWRPGKPHPQTWDGNYTKAWAVTAIN